MVYPAIVGGGGFTRAIGHHAAARFAPVAARTPVVPVRAGNAARPIPENGDELGDDTVRAAWRCCVHGGLRSEEHTSELQSLMRSSYAVFCLKQKRNQE